MIDIPYRLRAAAGAVVRATKTIEAWKSKRNMAGSDAIKLEDTAEWKAAEMIERLWKDGEAFRVAMVESGALTKVSQDLYMDQLRAFEGALALNNPHR